MCIIIDTNKISAFLKDPSSEDMQPIHTWLSERGGSFVCTTYGTYGQELKDFQHKLRAYYQSGQAKLYSEESIKSEEAAVKAINKHKSNDIHILALARASGARLLCTEDKNLKDDFKKKEIIDNPRGKIYPRIKRRDFLKKNPCKQSS